MTNWGEGVMTNWGEGVTSCKTLGLEEGVPPPGFL